jgi:hypothetical protein
MIRLSAIYTGTRLYQNPRGSAREFFMMRPATMFALGEENMLRFIRTGAMAALVSLSGLGLLEAGDITGSWKGFLIGADGTSAEVVVDFTSSGLPLYSYTNNQGVARQVELSKIGQTIEYVPSGGGVQRVVVKAIEVGAGRLSMELLGSFEKASQGYLDQHFEGALFEYALVPGGLKMKVTTQSTSHFGDKDRIVGGTPQAAVAEGLLKRVR